MALMTPAPGTGLIGYRAPILTTRPVPSPVMTSPGTTVWSRPTAPTAPVAPVYRLPVTALPQPAVPPANIGVVTAAPSLPAFGVVGPPLTPGASQSVLQPAITPNQVATQYGAYQEPVGYSLTTPVVSIPSPSDVGTPVNGSGVTFGMTDNTWLLVLIAAALVLFLVSE